MKTTANRRQFIGHVAGVAAAAAAPMVLAQPAPLKLIVGFPPGGAADILSRALAEPMRASLNRPVVVENRPGAAGRIAAEFVKNAAPDGTTVLVTPASVLTLAPYVYKNMRYEFSRDFAALGSVARLDLALYAGPAVPATVKTVADLQRWFQANPQLRSVAHPGPASTPHLAAMLLGRDAKLDWQAIPYQGDAPLFVALLGGQVPVAVSSVAGGIEHVRAGKLRMLATTGSQRSAFLPQVPTLAESGFGSVVVEDRHSVVAPRQTPAATVAAIGQALREAIQTKEVTSLLQRVALEPTGETPEQFGKWAEQDSMRWGTVVRGFNISLE